MSGGASRESYFLRSPRLAFRRWTAADLDLAVELWGDPRVTRYIDARERLDRAAVSTWLQRELACQREHGVQYWPLFTRRRERHVGCCGLRPHAARDRCLEIGVHVRPEHRRRGFAREAMGAVIGHAFDDLGCAELFAGHHPDNAASRALLESLGFVHTHDELYPPTGLRHPSYRLEPGAATRTRAR